MLGFCELHVQRDRCSYSSASECVSGQQQQHAKRGDHQARQIRCSKRCEIEDSELYSSTQITAASDSPVAWRCARSLASQTLSDRNCCARRVPPLDAFARTNRSSTVPELAAKDAAAEAAVVTGPAGQHGIVGAGVREVEDTKGATCAPILQAARRSPGESHTETEASLRAAGADGCAPFANGADNGDAAAFSLADTVAADSSPHATAAAPSTSGAGKRYATAAACLAERPAAAGCSADAWGTAFSARAASPEMLQWRHRADRQFTAEDVLRLYLCRCSSDVGGRRRSSSSNHCSRSVSGSTRGGTRKSDAIYVNTDSHCSSCSDTCTACCSTIESDNNNTGSDCRSGRCLGKSGYNSSSNGCTSSSSSSHSSAINTVKSKSSGGCSRAIRGNDGRSGCCVRSGTGQDAANEPCLLRGAHSCCDVLKWGVWDPATKERKASRRQCGKRVSSVACTNSSRNGDGVRCRGMSSERKQTVYNSTTSSTTDSGSPAAGCRCSRVCCRMSAQSYSNGTTGSRSLTCGTHTCTRRSRSIGSGSIRSSSIRMMTKTCVWTGGETCLGCLSEGGRGLPPASFRNEALPRWPTEMLLQGDAYCDVVSTSTAPPLPQTVEGAKQLQRELEGKVVQGATAAEAEQVFDECYRAATGPLRQAGAAEWGAAAAAAARRTTEAVIAAHEGGAGEKRAATGGAACEVTRDAGGAGAGAETPYFGPAAPRVVSVTTVVQDASGLPAATQKPSRVHFVCLADTSATGSATAAPAATDDERTGRRAKAATKSCALVSVCSSHTHFMEGVTAGQKKRRQFMPSKERCNGRGLAEKTAKHECATRGSGLPASDLEAVLEGRRARHRGAARLQAAGGRRRDISEAARAGEGDDVIAQTVIASRAEGGARGVKCSPAEPTATANFATAATAVAAAAAAAARRLKIPQPAAAPPAQRAAASAPATETPLLTCAAAEEEDAAYTIYFIWCSTCRRLHRQVEEPGCTCWALGAVASDGKTGRVPLTAVGGASAALATKRCTAGYDRLATAGTGARSAYYEGRASNGVAATVRKPVRAADGSVRPLHTPKEVVGVACDGSEGGRRCLEAAGAERCLATTSGVCGPAAYGEHERGAHKQAGTCEGKRVEPTANGGGTAVAAIPAEAEKEYGAARERVKGRGNVEVEPAAEQSVRSGAAHWEFPDISPTQTKEPQGGELRALETAGLKGGGDGDGCMQKKTEDGEGRTRFAACPWRALCVVESTDSGSDTAEEEDEELLLHAAGTPVDARTSPKRNLREDTGVAAAAAVCGPKKDTGRVICGTAAGARNSATAAAAGACVSVTPHRTSAAKAAVSSRAFRTSAGARAPKKTASGLYTTATVAAARPLRTSAGSFFPARDSRAAPGGVGIPAAEASSEDQKVEHCPDEAALTAFARCLTRGVGTATRASQGDIFYGAAAQNRCAVDAGGRSGNRRADRPADAAVSGSCGEWWAIGSGASRAAVASAVGTIRAHGVAVEASSNAVPADAGSAAAGDPAAAFLTIAAAAGSRAPSATAAAAITAAGTAAAASDAATAAAMPAVAAGAAAPAISAVSAAVGAAASSSVCTPTLLAWVTKREILRAVSSALLWGGRSRRGALRKRSEEQQQWERLQEQRQQQQQSLRRVQNHTEQQRYVGCAAGNAAEAEASSAADLTETVPAFEESCNLSTAVVSTEYEGAWCAAGGGTDTGTCCGAGRGPLEEDAEGRSRKPACTGRKQQAGIRSIPEGAFIDIGRSASVGDRRFPAAVIGTRTAGARAGLSAGAEERGADDDGGVLVAEQQLFALLHLGGGGEMIEHHSKEGEKRCASTVRGDTATGKVPLAARVSGFSSGEHLIACKRSAQNAEVAAVTTTQVGEGALEEAFLELAAGDPQRRAVSHAAESLAVGRSVPPAYAPPTAARRIRAPPQAADRVLGASPLLSDRSRISGAAEESLCAAWDESGGAREKPERTRLQKKQRTEPHCVPRRKGRRKMEWLSEAPFGVYIVEEAISEKEEKEILCWADKEGAGREDAPATLVSKEAAAGAGEEKEEEEEQQQQEGGAAARAGAEIAPRLMATGNSRAGAHRHPLEGGCVPERKKEFVALERENPQAERGVIGKVGAQKPFVPRWVDSQSGRMKMDFGPRVNFKKRRLKLDTFRGFPSFVRPLLQRFSSSFPPLQALLSAGTSSKLSEIPYAAAAPGAHAATSPLGGDENKRNIRKFSDEIAATANAYDTPRAAFPHAAEPVACSKASPADRSAAGKYDRDGMCTVAAPSRPNESEALARNDTQSPAEHFTRLLSPVADSIVVSTTKLYAAGSSTADVRSTPSTWPPEASQIAATSGELPALDGSDAAKRSCFEKCEDPVVDSSAASIPERIARGARPPPLQPEDDETVFRHPFIPVELCLLDYSPARNAHINEHIDDAWLWGPRLVTFSLAGSTFLSFVSPTMCLPFVLLKKLLPRAATGTKKTSSSRGIPHSISVCSDRDPLSSPGKRKSCNSSSSSTVQEESGKGVCCNESKPRPEAGQNGCSWSDTAAAEHVSDTSEEVTYTLGRERNWHRVTNSASADGIDGAESLLPGGRTQQHAPTFRSEQERLVEAKSRPGISKGDCGGGCERLVQGRTRVHQVAAEQGLEPGGAHEGRAGAAFPSGTERTAPHEEARGEREKNAGEAYPLETHLTRPGEERREKAGPSSPAPAGRGRAAVGLGVTEKTGTTAGAAEERGGRSFSASAHEATSVHVAEEHHSVKNGRFAEDEGPLEVLVRVRVEIRIPLRARSMAVVTGAARYQWAHAIRSHHVRERRVALTLRELAQEFLPGGPNEAVGGQLLVVAMASLAA